MIICSKRYTHVSLRRAAPIGERNSELGAVSLDPVVSRSLSGASLVINFGTKNRDRIRSSFLIKSRDKTFPFRKASLFRQRAVRKRPLRNPSLRDTGFKKPANSTAIQRICRICRSGLIRDVGSEERNGESAVLRRGAAGSGGSLDRSLVTSFYVSRARVPRSRMS